MPLYLVGGAVRDLLLGRPGRIADVDLVVEEDAPEFARELARRLKARVKLHGRFGTAVVEAPSGERLDLATARRESYDRPGALPRVRPGSIGDDLARRDFTVNAMAMEIARPGRPHLLDPFGGRADLRRRRIRMLHPRSAFDDATRAFRAVRYANRLGFTIDPETRRWIRDAVEGGAVDAVSGDRLRRELVLIFSEPDRSRAVRELARLGLAATVQRSLGADAATTRRLRAAERLATKPGPAPSWLVYLLAWMGEVSEEMAEAVAARLNLPRREGTAVLRWPQTSGRLAGASGASLPRRIAAIEGLSGDELLAAAALLPAASARRLLEARKAAGLRLGIRGRDLVAAGVPPGPAIGRALAATLSARRTGAIPAEEELSFAVKAARS
jgi:tRNA nucleotidyltransferase (CCA-adding enzyme)